MQKQVQSGGQHPRQDGDKRKEEKEKKLAEQREMALIFKPVQTQKVEKGTDPKSVVCAFFKQGTCTKGDKCKFSHDLSQENKVEKRSIYVDMRDEDDPMTNWDDAKLKEVVEKKSSGEKQRPTTDIVGLSLKNCLKLKTNLPCVSDLQILPGSCGKIKVRLVLGVPQRRKVHLPSRLASWICAEAR